MTKILAGDKTYSEFRTLIQQDESFLFAKQTVLSPVYDFETKDKFPVSKENNWLT